MENKANQDVAMDGQDKNLDYLGFSSDEEILKQLTDPKEIIMMSCKIGKWNKYNWQQERNFVVTNTAIYNFNKKSKSSPDLTVF